MKLVETDSPFNVKFTQKTEEANKKNSRRTIWISQCTHSNFLTAFEKFLAPVIGFANEDLSPTQVFNCHKLNKFSGGIPIQLDSMEEQFTPAVETLVNLDKQRGKDIQSNVTFYYHLLADDERLSKMDLEYWMDYLYLFGVKDIIPLYDKASILTYRNWDVYALLWAIFIGILFIDYYILSCCIKCCRRASKAKVE